MEQAAARANPDLPDQEGQLVHLDLPGRKAIKAIKETTVIPVLPVRVACVG